jgi:hypothetical protein
VVEVFSSLEMQVDRGTGLIGVRNDEVGASF